MHETTNLKQHKEAIAALYLYDERYVHLELGIMDFYNQLPQYEKRICKELVDRILNTKGRAQ